MKKQVSSAAAAILLFAMATLSDTLAAGQERAVDVDIRDRFVGAWRLLWLEEQGADGAAQRADGAARLHG